MLQHHWNPWGVIMPTFCRPWRQRSLWPTQPYHQRWCYDVSRVLVSWQPLMLLLCKSWHHNISRFSAIWCISYFWFLQGLPSMVRVPAWSLENVVTAWFSVTTRVMSYSAMGFVRTVVFPVKMGPFGMVTASVWISIKSAMATWIVKTTPMRRHAHTHVLLVISVVGCGLLRGVLFVWVASGDVMEKMTVWMVSMKATAALLVRLILCLVPVDCRIKGSNVYHWIIAVTV